LAVLNATANNSLTVAEPIESTVDRAQAFETHLAEARYFLPFMSWTCSALIALNCMFILNQGRMPVDRRNDALCCLRMVLVLFTIVYIIWGVFVMSAYDTPKFAPHDWDSSIFRLMGVAVEESFEGLMDILWRPVFLLQNNGFAVHVQRELAKRLAFVPVVDVTCIQGYIPEWNVYTSLSEMVASFHQVWVASGWPRTQCWVFFPWIWSCFELILWGSRALTYTPAVVTVDQGSGQSASEVNTQAVEATAAVRPEAMTPEAMARREERRRRRAAAEAAASASAAAAFDAADAGV